MDYGRLRAIAILIAALCSATTMELLPLLLRLKRHWPLLLRLSASKVIRHARFAFPPLVPCAP
jgi:hypothetical protein